MITQKGYICFDPRSLTNADKMFKPFWMIIKLYKDDNTREYYEWFIKKRYGLILQRPAFGAHISVIRGETIDKNIWNFYKEKYNNKDIKFYHKNELRTNGKHWWIKVYCDFVEDIREKMGYLRKGLFGLHLTLGMPILRQEVYSFYIHQNILKYEKTI